jgi:hypothetical protein
MRLLIKKVIIAAAAWSAAVAATPHTVKTPGLLHNQSHARGMLHALKGTDGVVHGLQKTAQQMEWVETSSANFLYSPMNNAWALDFRDTSIYDSQGRLAMVKTSLAHAGWNTDSLYEIDSTLWQGSQPLQYDSLYFNNGVIDRDNSVSLTLGYSADRKTFIKTKYIYGSDSWVMAGVDSLFCASPITDPSFYQYNDSSQFISLRSYAMSGSSGALLLVSSTMKIDAESNSTKLTLLTVTANAGTMDSSKIYETISSINKIITSDSVIVKSASGSWSAFSRASNSYNTGGDWFFRQQMLLHGAWVTSDSLLWLVDGGGYEIYHPTPDSLEAYFWDDYGDDTLEVTANKTDTTYRHWIATYDNNDNILNKVGYTSDKSGSNKIKTDSSAFTSAQITVNSVRFNRCSPAAKAVRFEQTPTMLRISAAQITGLRLYDLTGRMMASINQPAASTLAFFWRSLRTRPAMKVYAAQVITGKGIFTLRVR